MNRKGTLEQNDISIIIGNLPKRLQDKITQGNNVGSNAGSKAENVLQKKATTGGKTKNFSAVTAASTTGHDGGSASIEQKQLASTCKKHVAAIGVLSSSGAAKTKSVAKSQPVLEASGSSSSNTEIVKKREDVKTDLAIPGIIRLNMEDAKIMKNNCNKIEEDLCHPNERRSKYQHNNQHNPHHHNKLNSFNDLPMSPVRQIHKVSHPSWFNLLDDKINKDNLLGLFEELQKLMNQQQVLENWSTINNIRKQLQSIYKILCINFIKFCCDQKVDTFFWKILFYNVRESLKQQQSSNYGCSLQKNVLELIEDGIAFYQDLYQQLHSKYLDKSNNTTHQFASTATDIASRSQHKLGLIGKVVAQKLLIFLGDLWRYKIKDMQQRDFSQAANYYHRAKCLVPSNGIPYNQLAIVALYDRKKFDAIYYHMRSLMSSNANYAAKESLLVLFDEIRKKYEDIELKSSPIHQHYFYNNSGNSSHQSKSMRKEVWIYPDGVRRLHRTEVHGFNHPTKLAISEEKRYMDLTAEELLRRITSLYLYIIGKLFTGIGMETILEHQRKLVLQLGVLFKRQRITFSRARILKMLALNIFVVEHNLQKDTRRYHALNFCNQIFGLLLKKSNELLIDLNENPEEFEDENFMELNTLLQYNRVYVLWLQQSINIWESVKSEDHISLDTWLELEKLFLLIENENLYIPNDQDIIFEEDIFLAGFNPLSNAIQKMKSSDTTASDESLQFKKRLQIIKNFQVIYQENQNLLAVTQESHFVNEDLNLEIKQVLDELQQTSRQSNKCWKNNQQSNLLHDDDDDDDELEADELRCNLENLNVNGCIESPARHSKGGREGALKLKSTQKNEQISQLTKLKKELEVKNKTKKMYNDKLEEILKFVDTKVYIEVRPKYLLPDTNCFIDCLEDFQRIVNEFKVYTLIIPLTVVKELDGLSKGIKVESYKDSLQKQRIHHYDDVSTRAKKSLDFIKTTKNNVKCATTKGSIINSSLFALVEEENVSNDDKILATAMALSKTMGSETSKDGKCFIQTELVLITTDRNLRVKALSRNLAVSELTEFLQWAKECS